MRCVDCAHASGRDDDPKRGRALGLMARQGLLVCDRSDFRATFHAAMQVRECSMYEPADEDAAAARRAWFARQVPDDQLPPALRGGALEVF